jgi:hypothetical protein
MLSLRKLMLMTVSSQPGADAYCTSKQNIDMV